MSPAAHALCLALILAAPAPVLATPRHAPPDTARADSSTSAGLLAIATSPRGDVLAALPWTRATLRLDGAAGNKSFTPPHVEQGPEVDGVLDDDVWSRAAVLASFTHSRPVEGVGDSLGTVALVLYDDRNLYVAFHAGDDPRRVQAPVVPRDQIHQGDWVGVSIDTWHDRQRSFFLCANPLGIQMDGIDQEGRDSDMAPDFQYTSRGRVTERGYEVEMAIPFKTLRFPPGGKVTFGFQAIRDVRRDGTHMYWAPVSRDVNSYHAQIGTLEGLDRVRPGRNLEILPTHTTTTLGSRAADGLEFESPRGRFGLGVKAGLGSNLIADVAVTPDFSQVEADAGVVDINERFAIFFPEKRPFFLEGSDLFTTPVNLVYTRRIVDPLYGAKVTGKVGRTSLAVLNAADRSAAHGLPGVPPAVDPYLDHRAGYTIARLKQDVLGSSSVGLLLGDRTHHDQFNRLVGVDGRLRWRDRYSFSFQAARSWSREPDLSETIDGLEPEERDDLSEEVRRLAGRSREGHAFHGEIARDTRPLNLGLALLGFSPDFSADMGFVQRTNMVELQSWVRPHVWGDGKQWYTALHFPMYYGRTYRYGSDELTDEVISLVQEAVLPRNSWIGMEHVRRFVRHEGIDFPDLFRHAVWAGSERYRAVRAGGLYVWGDQVVFAEAARGRDRRWEIWSDLRFSSRLDAGVLLRGSSVWRDEGNARFADVLIPRMRVSYQFSKELSLRWITEMRARKGYDAAGTLVSRQNTLTPDVLLSYYVRPGTVVYLGYGSLLAGERTNDLRPEQSSLFTKVSYLWQM